MVFKALAVLSQGKCVYIEVNRKALIHPVAYDYREAFVIVHRPFLISLDSASKAVSECIQLQELSTCSGKWKRQERKDRQGGEFS